MFVISKKPALEEIKGFLLYIVCISILILGCPANLPVATNEDNTDSLDVDDTLSNIPSPRANDSLLMRNLLDLNGMESQLVSNYVTWSDNHIQKIDLVSECV